MFFQYRIKAEEQLERRHKPALNQDTGGDDTQRPDPRAHRQTLEPGHQRELGFSEPAEDASPACVGGGHGTGFWGPDIRWD